MPQTLAEQTASFITESFTDGEASDGAPTALENAAAAANQSGEGAAAEGGEGQDAAAAEGAEGEGGEGGEGEDGEGEAGQSGEGQQPAAAGGDKGKGGKGGKSVADRIGELTANYRGAQREADTQKSRADALQAELDALKSGKAPLTPQPAPATGGEGAPDPSQFDYGELDPKYIAALTRFETAQALKAAKADDDKKRQDDAAAAQQQEIARKARDMVKAGVALHDDFDEVVMQGARENKWDLSPHLGQLLLDSEFGAQIAYDLAKNPAEATRVFNLSATDQAKFLGRQEAKFEAAKSSQGKTPPKAPQAAPPPKTPRGNSGSNKVGADSTDFAAVERAYRAGELR
jgi:hypothetical protein